MIKLIRTIFNVLISCILGDLLFRYIYNSSDGMPWLFQSFRSALISIHVLKSDSSYDVENIFFEMVLLIAILFVGTIVWLGNRLAQRYMSARAAK